MAPQWYRFVLAGEPTPEQLACFPELIPTPGAAAGTTVLSGPADSTRDLQLVLARFRQHGLTVLGSFRLLEAPEAGTLPGRE
ncbi:hypothetical protein [Nocardia sp. NPDC057353]|uniref:hypothetical protein n=1 Tax=Nocardia sp. NPDC057353 TaxID=3346104 RepID=UPI003629F9C2